MSLTPCPESRVTSSELFGCAETDVPVFLTRKQHDKLMRADCPPGDPDGMLLKQQLYDIHQRALALDPRACLCILIDEPNPRAEGRGSDASATAERGKQS